MHVIGPLDGTRHLLQRQFWCSMHDMRDEELMQTLLWSGSALHNVHLKVCLVVLPAEESH